MLRRTGATLTAEQTHQLQRPLVRERRRAALGHRQSPQIRPMMQKRGNGAQAPRGSRTLPGCNGADPTGNLRSLRVGRARPVRGQETAAAEAGCVSDCAAIAKRSSWCSGLPGWTETRNQMQSSRRDDLLAGECTRRHRQERGSLIDRADYLGSSGIGHHRSSRMRASVRSSRWPSHHRSSAR